MSSLGQQNESSQAGASGDGSSRCFGACSCSLSSHGDEFLIVVEFLGVAGEGTMSAAAVSGGS
jgi:hypothetical protein